MEPDSSLGGGGGGCDGDGGGGGAAGEPGGLFKLGVGVVVGSLLGYNWGVGGHVSPEHWWVLCRTWRVSPNPKTRPVTTIAVAMNIKILVALPT